MRLPPAGHFIRQLLVELRGARAATGAEHGADPAVHAEFAAGDWVRRCTAVKAPASAQWEASASSRMMSGG
jgi:hypothetical protein